LRAPRATPTPTRQPTPARANTSAANSNSNTTKPQSFPKAWLWSRLPIPFGTDDGQDLFKTRHIGTLKAFFIDKTEVTNANYKKFIDATGHKPPEDWQNGNFKEGQAISLWVNVTWQDAAIYAKWQVSVAYRSRMGKRRSGIDGRNIHGHEWDKSFANVDETVSQKLANSLKAKPVGALDMIGNVWELTVMSLPSIRKQCSDA